MRRFTLLGLALLTLVVVLPLVTGRDEGLPLPRGEQQPHGPDYYMNNFALTRFDSTGHPEQTLTGQRMVEIPSRDITEVSHPHLRVHRGAGPDWQIRAERAEVDREADHIRLLESVEIRRPADTGRQLTNIQLTTEALDLYPERHYAETDQPLTILRDQHSRIDATGMRAYLDRQEYELLADVRGRLQPAKGE